MKASWKFGDMSFEFEGATTKDIFKQIASAQVTFQDEKCGACGSDEVTYIVRQAESDGEKHEYLELHCRKCGSKLAFGLGKDGSLYPKRYKTGKKGKAVLEGGKAVLLPNKGWTKYIPVEKDEDEG